MSDSTWMNVKNNKIAWKYHIQQNYTLLKAHKIIKYLAG